MRAILLAAGMGTRLRPLTIDTPKSLINVNGKPMLETQIEFLKEKGIDDIIVVTGYLSEKFEYIKEKYGVKLIHNDKYDTYNNIHKEPQVPKEVLVKCIHNNRMLLLCTLHQQSIQMLLCLAAVLITFSYRLF